jgi:hypothetical protein
MRSMVELLGSIGLHPSHQGEEARRSECCAAKYEICIQRTLLRPAPQTPDF